MTDIDHAAILRQHADTRRRGHSVNPDVLRAAADEIERLRDELTASHESHGNAIVRHPADANELRQVMEERDEARRDACMSWAWMYRPSENAETEARKEAKRRGWDCYREDTNER